MFALVVFAANAKAEINSNCFDLYMRPNMGDPGQFCVDYPEGLGAGRNVTVSLFGYTSTTRYLIESFDATINQSHTTQNGRFALWTAFPISGTGNHFSIDLVQFDEPGRPKFSTVVIRNLEDGHTQTQIADHINHGNNSTPACHYHCK